MHPTHYIHIIYIYICKAPGDLIISAAQCFSAMMAQQIQPLATIGAVHQGVGVGILLTIVLALAA